MNVFRPKRKRGSSHKSEASRYYTAEHRFAGDHKPKRKALRVTRKDVAVKLGWEWVRQEEARRGGIAEADYRQAELPPLVNDYLVSLRRGQNRTVEHVRKSRQRLERIFNDLKWRQICDASPAGLRKWLEGYEGSAKTANHYRQAVVAFFNWLERDGLLDENPIARVRPLRGAAKRTEEKSVFSFGEVERLIAVDPARSLVYAMLFYTGLRQAELQRLRVRDLDLDVEQPWVLLPAAASKARRFDPIALHPCLLHPLRVRCRARQADDLVCPNRVTRRTFQKDLERAGIPRADRHGRNRSAHSLRHSFVTQAQASGVEPSVVQRLARLSSPKIAQEVYTDGLGLNLHAAIQHLPALDIDAGGRTGAIGPKRDIVTHAETAGAVAMPSETARPQQVRHTLRQGETPRYSGSEKWSRGESNPRVGSAAMAPLRV